MKVTRLEFEAAVAAYWSTRTSQRAASVIANAAGAGTAGAVRGGKHFDTLIRLLATFFLKAGYPPSSIRTVQTQLPGYYRPTKQWDLMVVHEGTLVAAFELKSLARPSFGNNYNNRIEEALGSAVDLNRTVRAETLPGERPWLGYLFLMEDAPESRRPVGITRGVFEVEPIWRTMQSYQERLAVFCERVLADGLYDAVCYVVSAPDHPRPIEPVPALDWQHFSAAIQARITYLAGLGFPGP